MSESINMWRTLIMAALGHDLMFMAWSEQDAANAFDRYTRALKDLDPSMWTARKANGQQCIRFTNGGLIRFTSYGGRAHLDGLRSRAVIVDE